MIKTSVALAALALCAAAVPAQAELVYAVPVPPGPGAASQVFSGTLIETGTPGDLSVNDGVLGFDATAFSDSQFTLTVSFPTMPFTVGQLTSPMVLGLGAGTNSFTLVGMRFYDRNAAGQPGIGTTGAYSQVVASNPGAFETVPFKIFTTPADFGAPDLGFIAQDANTVRFSFQLAAGQTIHLDSVANPEPSSVALFGLGALGLGGIARRRRRRRAATTK